MEPICTLVGSKATVEIFETSGGFQIQHPSLASSSNPEGVYVTSEESIVLRYARKIAQEGSAL